MEYSMWHQIWDLPKNMLLLKNSQFLRNHYENWWKCGTHEYHIFTNFRNDFVKIVDFLIKAYSWVSLKFGVTYCNIFKQILLSWNCASSQNSEKLTIKIFHRSFCEKFTVSISLICGINIWWLIDCSNFIVTLTTLNTRCKIREYMVSEIYTLLFQQRPVILSKSALWTWVHMVGKLDLIFCNKNSNFIFPPCVLTRPTFIKYKPLAPYPIFSRVVTILQKMR